jgi:epsilon-lactone hydrolase
VASWQMHVVAFALRMTRRRHWTSADRARRIIERTPREAAPPRRLTRRHDVSRREVEGFPVWTVRPRDGSGPAAVYLHGGAYVEGIAPQHWTLIGRLADAGVRVEVPQYGLAPRYSHREAFPFLHRVWAELFAEAPPEGVVLAGDSAGGGLALALAQELVAAGGDGPARLVLLSPWLDLTLSHPELPRYEARDPWLAAAGIRAAGLAWADGNDPTLPRLSPGNGELTDLPPTSVLVGTREIGYPDAETFAGRAAAAGVDVELIIADGAVHVYPLVPAPEGTEGTRAVIEAVTGQPAAPEEPVVQAGRRRRRWR